MIVIGERRLAQKAYVYLVSDFDMEVVDGVSERELLQS